MLRPMLTALVLCLAANDGVGLSEPPSLDEARGQTRLRFDLQFALAGVYTAFIPGGGPGFTAELGATFHDRLSLVGRVTVATIVVVNTVQFAVALSYPLSERLELGVGLSTIWVGGFGTDFPSALAELAPIRLMFSPGERPRGAVRRSGLVFCVEAAPGVVWAGSAGLRGPGAPPVVSPFAFGLTLGVGYAWW